MPRTPSSPILLRGVAFAMLALACACAGAQSSGQQGGPGGPGQGQGQGGSEQGQGGQQGGHRRGPPPQALAACANSTSGAQCSFEGREGRTVSGTCFAPESSLPLACRPAHMGGQGQGPQGSSAGPARGPSGQGQPPGGAGD